MIEDMTLRNMLEEALTKLTNERGGTFKIVDSKKAGGPLSVFLNKPGHKACYLHNVSRGLLAICGTGLIKVLEIIHDSWINQNLEKINVCNTVLDHRFKQRLVETGSEFDKQSTRFILDRAKRLAHGNNPENVIAMDRAISLMKVETFNDSQSVDFLFKTPERFKNVSAMIRRLTQHSYLACDEDMKYSIMVLNGTTNDAKKKRAAMGSLMGVDQLVIKMLCELVDNHGTVNFIKRYAKFLEDDRLKVQTLASVDDINTLVAGMKCI